MFMSLLFFKKIIINQLLSSPIFCASVAGFPPVHLSTNYPFLYVINVGIDLTSNYSAISYALSMLI